MGKSGGEFDVLIIGSGFGGSVTALRLAEKGYRVGVVEAGRRFGPGDFARTNWNLRRFLWMPGLGMRGIQRLDLLRQVLILSGAGVGGGSLVYANTLLEPHDAFFEDPQWRGITDWKQELAPYYDLARRMLGRVTAPADTPADGILAAVARHFGVEHTHEPTTIGVFLGEPEKRVPDPFFGGAGPECVGCKRCGGCMVGCRFEAKNTLDRNYLYLAESLGARVFAEHAAVDVEEEAGRWRVTTERPGAWVRKRRRTFTADHIVFAAGALRTTRLLLHLQAAGRLPHLSSRVGYLVRTNSESLLGAGAKKRTVDYSQGVAITSSIHPVPDTRIEPCRYPPGSNFMGLIASILVKGEGRLPQPLRFIATALRHPIAFVRSMSVYHWSERSVILLVMQSLDNSLRLFTKKGLFGTRVASTQGHGQPNPTWLPVAHEAARAAAKALDGIPAASINESLLGIPMTAHILGGAAIGASPEQGVIDPYHRVYGHPALSVIDGATVSANLGSNPSLTITALAERAAAMWPNKGEPDPRPAPGEAYRPVAAVQPVRPAVPTGAPAALKW
ncbi:MAG: GMC family oxidoreductase [Acidimicrobiia bacterium]|nr:GMC family oxidoreductase [Acidimicrobiia bacterium]